MRFQFIFVGFLALFFNSCFGYDDCGSKDGELQVIEITGCPDLDQRCILHRNTNVSLTMKFTPKKDITNVTSIVHGVVLGVAVPFKLPNPDGCFESGLTCPLKAGVPVTYIAILPVEKKYPKVTVDVKWELKDEDDQDILCLLIQSKIL